MTSGPILISFSSDNTDQFENTTEDLEDAEAVAIFDK